jgi:hypothetical protein
VVSISLVTAVVLHRNLLVPILLAVVEVDLLLMNIIVKKLSVTKFLQREQTTLP